MKKVGVLAVQGAFSLHRPHIEALGGKYIPVSKASDFETLDALILPGGESSVMLKLLKLKGIEKTLKEFASEKPSWGICAGVILLAEKVSNPQQESLGLLPIEVTRNSYGRQLQSFEKDIEGCKVSFIRAPSLRPLSDKLSIKSTLNREAVWVSYKNRQGTAFHPELATTYPSYFHQNFYQSL